MPQEELKEIKKSTVVSLERNENEDFTPEKDGKKMQTLKGYNIEFQNGDKGVTRTNKNEPKFVVGEEAMYKTKILTSEKKPDWKKYIFTYYQAEQRGESMWQDVVFRQRDMFLKCQEIAVRIIVVLGKHNEVNKESLGKIANSIYKTVKQQAGEDNKKERLILQSFWAVLEYTELACYTFEKTSDIIDEAILLFDETLKIEQ